MCCGCSRSAQPAESPPVEPDVSQQPQEPEAPTAPEPAPTLTSSTETVVARILEAGPSGSGRCVQRSYRIERTDTSAGDSFWVHFEHCQGEPPSSFDGAGLSIGETYRLRLQPGASPNFGDDPMIVGVEPP